MSLVEALVAFLVTALGMLAIVSMQSTLRFNADVAKQRSEAVRLAQEELEALRGFSVLEVNPDSPSYEAIVTAASRQVADPDSEYNTTYNLVRTVTDDDDFRMKTVAATVTWKDRANQDVSITLHSQIHGIDPQLSGVLSLAANGLPAQRSLSRIGGVPLPVKDLGNGTSAYKPAEGGSVAWVFNNSTGVIVNLCSVPPSTATQNLTVSDLNGCSTIVGYLLAGYVRFATGGNADAAAAENPTSPALDLAMNISFATGGTYPAPQCYDNSNADPGIKVQYLCLVQPNTEPDAEPWYSARLTVEPVGGWAYGTTDTTYRLCRYSADYNGDGTIQNAEHPADYVDVNGNLVNQNFLVVRGDNQCPEDGPPNPAAGDLINANTVQLLPLSGP